MSYLMDTMILSELVCFNLGRKSAGGQKGGETYYVKKFINVRTNECI